MNLPAVENFTREVNNMMFPSFGMQLLSALVEFTGVSILAHCLSRRLASEELSSLHGWKDLGWPRFCVLLVFLDSWLFLFTCGILIFGVGLERGIAICSLSIYLCIAFYGTSKLFIYCFLIEKVHIVWAPTANTKRFRSPIYIVCVVTVSLYAVVAALMYSGRVHYFRADGACVTGVKLYASIPLLTYDLYINIFMTSLFLWPLIKTGKIHPMLRRVAKRTLFAAIVALSTSSINVLVLTLLHGKELGWVCLGSCGADVICNSLALFWATERTGPNFSANIKVGKPSFVTHDDGSSKLHAMVPQNPTESFPSFSQSKGDEQGHLRPQYKTHKSDASITHSNQGMPGPSLARLHSLSPSRSSKLPRAMDSVADFFRKSQEQPREEHQLEVTITTECKVVEETIIDGTQED